MTKRAKFVRAAIVALALAMLGAMPAMAQTSGVPGKPTGLMATAVNSGQIDLSWTAPTDVGDSAITMYVLELSSDGNAPWSGVFGTGDRSGTTFSDEFVPSNTTRHYRVSARNSNGQGPPSDTASATTPVDTTPPRVIQATIRDDGADITLLTDELMMLDISLPTNLLVVATETGQHGIRRITQGLANSGKGIQIHLHGGANRIRTGQVVRISYMDPTSGDDEALQNTAGIDMESFSLGPGAGDLLEVSNGSENRPGVPGVPRTLEARGVDEETIRLRWEPPRHANGRVITGYRIESSANGTTGWTDLEDDTGNTDTVYEDSGLTSGTTRHYRVSAINSEGTGAASASASATTVVPTGHFSISLSPDIIQEGSPSTWTVTATTTADTQPIAATAVTVRVATLNDTRPGSGTENKDYTPIDTTVTFSQSDFTRQMIAGNYRYVATKTGTFDTLDDNDVEGYERITIEASIEGDGQGWTVTGSRAHARIGSEDEWRIELSADVTEIYEGETRAVTFTTRVLPEADCLIPFDLTMVATEDANASSANFQDWRTTEDKGIIPACSNEPVQWTVQLTALVDARDDDGEILVLESVAGPGENVSNNELMAIGAPASVGTVSITIRERRSVVIKAPESLEIGEDDSVTYRVRLATRPSGNVIVRPRATGNAIEVSPSTLTFTKSNWHGDRTVTVRGIRDSDDEEENVSITHTVSGADYHGLSARTIPVKVLEGPTRYGQVRLRERQTHSDGSVSGRLEVGYHGRWGTVCDDRFPEAETPELACRLLGFETGEVTENRNSATFNRIPPHESPWWRGVAIPDDVMPIWLDDVVCDEGSTHWTDEAPRRLDQCWNAGVGLHNCTREEDVWLKCSGTYDGAEQVRGRPIVYVRDASATEGTNPNMTFKVWLTRVLTGAQTVTVNYETVAVSDAAEHLGVSRNPATEGTDYTRTTGTLTFTSTSPTRPRYGFAPLRAHMDHTIMELEIQVPIVDDSAEDSGEIFRMELSNIVGGAQFSILSGNRATGIIFNHEDDTSVQAEFRNTPYGHDGSAFTVELAFAEMIEATPESIGAALSVAGGTLDGVSQLEADDARYWSVSVTPATAEDAVTVTLESNAECGETGAVCTSDGRQLREAVEITITTTTALAEAPAITGIAQVGNTLEAAFAEEPGGEISWQWLRGEEPIEGAEEPSYKVNEADAGHTLSVQATRGQETVSSEPTGTVWAAPSHPHAALGEEELFSTTITLGSDQTYPAHLGGYGNLSGIAFGASDTTTFTAEGSGYTLTLFMVNDAGGIGVATEPPIAGGGLVAYWNRERIEGFESQPGPGGETVLSGDTAHTGAESMRYTNGSADGVRVGVTLRRAYEVTRIVSARITSGPGDNGTWDTGETVEARMRFSAPVRIVVPEGYESRAVEVPVNVGRGTTPRLRHASGSGTDTLAFAYTVDDVANGATQAVLAGMRLILNGLRIVDGSGRDADVRYSPSPQIRSVTLIPDASGDRAWTEGEAVEVRLAFSEAVTVEDGTPALGVTVAGEAATLDYASGSGSATLVFSRSVGEGERFSEIAVTADSLALNGARIVSNRGMEAAPVHAGTEATAAPAEVAPLTATFTGLPGAHGNAAFTIELAFSETLAESFSYRTLADGTSPSAIRVSNGGVTSVRRIVREGPERNRRWSLGVTPNGDGDVTVTLAASPACTETGAVCTGDGRRLAEAVAVTIAQGQEAGTQEPPFTVALAGVPAEHDGSTAFTFELAFSEEPKAGYSYETLRDDTLEVRQGGTRLVPHVKRLDKPRNRRWSVTVTPSDDAVLSKADIAVSVGPKASCEAAGAVCTADDEALSNAVSRTILGPPGLSAADAKATEAVGATVDFAVTLSRPSTSQVTVDYATSDGTATAGADYTAASGTLTFAAGDTEKTVPVPVLDDGVDEGQESFTLTLSNADGGNAYLADSSATGTIENSDHMPKAWLARFGRTAATHVLDAVEERLEGGAGESWVRLGGHQLGGGAPDVMESARRLAPAGNLWKEEAPVDPTGQDMTPGELLLGSAFHLVSNPEEDNPFGPRLTAWGRVAASGFDAGEDRMTLSGTVTTATLGVDGVFARWLTGVALAYSQGEGSFTQAEAPSGDLTSTLTSVHPYVGYAVGERVKLWGMVGYGTGSLELGLSGQEPLRTDIDMAMGALGARGVLLSTAGGLELAIRSDVLWVNTASAATPGMVQTEADTNRLRLVLEGSRHFSFTAGGTLTPTVELGLRRDGGDAETGSGVEVGGRLLYASLSGLSIEASLRALVVHEASEYREWGASGALRYDPGLSGLGLTAQVTPAWGMAASGVGRLWSQPDAQGLGGAPGISSSPAARLDAELGYGLRAMNGQGVLTPYVRGSLVEGSEQAWHVGTRLTLAESLTMSLEATHRQGLHETSAQELALLATVPF